MRNQLPQILFTLVKRDNVHRRVLFHQQIHGRILCIYAAQFGNLRNRLSHQRLIRRRGHR